eukprot:m.61283 g.61283  ORF g.61283 m.61283 type:complete len:363 (-) comp11393_c0_seq2:118-1206(-)
MASTMATTTTTPYIMAPLLWENLGDFSKVVSVLNWIVITLGICTTSLVTFEIFISRKIKFQVERLTIVLMATHLLVGVTFLVLNVDSAAKMSSESESKVLAVNCGAFHALLYVVLCVEIMINVIANHALFIGRKEVPFRLEIFGYIGTIVVSSIVLIYIEVIRSHQQTGPKTIQEMVSFNNTMKSVEFAWIICSLFLISSYGIFRFRLWEQRLTWTNLENQFEALGESITETSRKLIEVHKKAVEQVAVPLSRFFFGFAFAFLGMIMIVLWRKFNKTMTEDNEKFLYPLGWLFINTQRLWISVVYITANWENFQPGQLKLRFRRRFFMHRRNTDGKHVQLRFDTNEPQQKMIEAEEDEYEQY